MKALSIFYTLPILSILYACGASIGDGASGDDDINTGSNEASNINNSSVELNSVINCDEGSSLSYKNFGNAFLLDHCTTCHSSEINNNERLNAPIEMNFDSIELVQIWRANILEVMQKKENSMPPTYELNQEEKDNFINWLRCGAPVGAHSYP
ncbi:MAG: hypothetical protein R3B45_02020 [Bdellovibrionota bacterium]